MTMNERRQVNFWALAIGALLVMGLAMLISVMLVVKWFRAPDTSRVYNTTTVLQQIQSLSDLVTVKYVLEKVVIVEDAKWYGENRVLLVAHGIVKAGVDLRQIKAEQVRFSEDKLVIQLPPAHITDVYLDDRHTQIIERTTGLLREFDKDLEQNARRIATADIRSAALASGIINEAALRAKAQLTILFQQLGYKTVEIKTP